MKKMFSLGILLFSLLFLLGSCSELPWQEPYEPGMVKESGPAPTVQPIPVTAIPKEVRVVIRQVNSNSSDYYLWSSKLGTSSKKRLAWQDVKDASPRELFFTKEGFSLGGKKYIGALELERDAKNTLRLINVIGIEDYLKGVIPAEMPPTWPIEALKAQAVVARTYALYDLSQKGGFLESSVMDQVYKGEQARKLKTDLAVGETKGQVLTFEGNIFPSYFHSTSGGRTTSILYVWPSKQDFKAIESVRDEHSLSAPQQNWQTGISPSELSAILKKNGYNFGEITSLQVLKRDPTERVISIQVTGSIGGLSPKRVFQGNDFRMMLGWLKLKSTLFEIKSSGGKFIFIGHGFGHGVGMSQWGAKIMGEKGFRYQDILKFYFPKAELKTRS